MPQRCAIKTLSLAIILLCHTGANSVVAQTISQLTCYSTVFAPFVIEENGQVKGIDVDAVKEVGKRLGIDITFALKPWKRLENEVETGDSNCVAAYFRTPERLKYMDFTNVPLHITAYTLFTKHKRPTPFRSFEQIKGWTIGINRGFKTTPAFEHALKMNWVTKYEVKNEAQSVKMISLDRLDALLTNYHVGLYNINLLGKTDITPISPSLSSTPAYLVFSKKAKLDWLVPLFDEALFEILQDGTYQKIFDAYLLPASK